MAEKAYNLYATNTNYYSVLIGLSGILKRIRFSFSGGAITAGSYSTQIYISPETTVSTKMKFHYNFARIVDAAPAGNETSDLTKSFDTNFYIDKLDYLNLYNNSGATVTAYVFLDIVPVSDKTRLYLGGEYHNQ